MGDKKLINHYATLEIAKDATPDQIKKAYRKLQTLYHPDKNSGAPEHLIRLAEEKTKEINAAKEVLLDPGKRAEFDRALHASERGNAPAKPAFVPDSIDFGRINAGETYRAHFDIQNVGGPPISPPDLDMSPDSDWLDVTQVAPSDPDRFWFGLEVTVTNLSDSAKETGPREAWISIAVDGSTARANVSGVVEPNLSSRRLSVDILAGELIDSTDFYAELGGDVLHCGRDLSPLIDRLAHNSDVDPYPEDWLIEKFDKEKEEFQRVLRLMRASEKHGYRPNDQPMRNGWNRFLKSGDLPKALLIDSNFSESTADTIIAARVTEFARDLTVVSKQIWAATYYLQASAKLGLAGANAASNRCGNLRVLNALLAVVGEAFAAYLVANELSHSDKKILEAIELAERLKQEILVAISQVEMKRSKWLHSKHLCVECEKSLRWTERLSGADRHADCSAKFGRSVILNKPWWMSGKVVLGVGILVVAIPIVSNISSVYSRAPSQLVEDGVCPGEGCIYGDNWKATEDVLTLTVSPSVIGEFSGTQVVIPKGNWVRTLNGRVLSMKGKARVKANQTQWEQGEQNVPELREGDILPIYASLGEGRYTTWMEGRTHVIVGPEIIRDSIKEWWVQLRTRTAGVVWTKADQGGPFVSQGEFNARLAVLIAKKDLPIRQKLEQVGALLNEGADLNFSGPGLWGDSPRDSALYANDVPLMRALMARGLDLKRGCAANIAAQQAVTWPDTRMLEFLLTNGVQVGCLSAPPMHSFLGFGIATPTYSLERALQVGELLLNHGVELYQRDSQGRTIFDVLDTGIARHGATRIQELKRSLNSFKATVSGRLGQSESPLLQKSNA